MKPCFFIRVLRLTAVSLALFPAGAWANGGGLPFPVGEELTYTITWNGIPVAWSKAVTERDVVEGRDVLAIRLYTRTFSFFDHFFPVNDFHESLIDPVSFLPLRYSHNLQEGNYRCHEVTRFDFETLKAHYRHVINGKEKTYDIKPGLRDILSFLYFMRSENLTERSRNSYRVMSDEKVYDLLVTAYGIENIDLPHYERDVPSLEVKPEAMLDGLFVRKGKATVWVSRDSRRLMTRARLSVPFGRVSVVLHEVRGPGNDFWITEMKDGDEDERNEENNRGDPGAMGLDPASRQTAGDDCRQTDDSAGG